VSFRDDESRQLAYKVGFSGESWVCPDNAYGLEIGTNSGDPKRGGSQAVVGFAPMPYPDIDPRGYSADDAMIIYEALIRKLAGFAAWLVGQSYALALFGTDVGVDPIAVENLQTALLRNHQISSSQYSVSHSVKSARHLLERMAQMDYIVTCRFHGVVFAHLLNKPVLAIAHHPKVSDLMAELELSHYCVDIRDFTQASLVDRFSSMVTNADEIKFRMGTSLVKKREQLRNQYDKLFLGLAAASKKG
jgi:polysaccharide pyruvyl transferase WcaK-like protein